MIRAADFLYSHFALKELKFFALNAELVFLHLMEGIAEKAKYIY